MKRRDFIVGAGSAVALPTIARAPMRVPAKTIACASIRAPSSTTSGSPSSGAAAVERGDSEGRLPRIAPSWISFSMAFIVFGFADCRKAKSGSVSRGRFITVSELIDPSIYRAATKTESK